MSGPEKTSLIIMACCVLHNWAVRRNIELDIIEDGLQEAIRRERQGRQEVARHRGNAYQLGLATGMCRNINFRTMILIRNISMGNL